ncbi:MAG: Gfo/Idh/MocA family oxidoreductase, partial [Hyphomicrobiales bacterium]|nr:Gfo/Idh/MocA family oxidoreductase [Hyphomicrobiales bacterium]
MKAFANPVVEMLGRRLRLGVVGGGDGSFIGTVHRAAARLDDRFEVVAGVLSSKPDKARALGRQLGLEKSRAYGSAADMIAEEAARDDGIDAVAVMTPNHLHLPECRRAIETGLDVICDKPLTTNLTEALELVTLVRGHGAVFCLTHNYSGYPMVRQARAMVAAGEIGDVRQVHVEYAQGQLSTFVEPEAPERLKWRLDPARGGPSAVLGDIGTHAHQLVTFITGQQVTRLSADVGATVPDRTNDDYAALLMRMENGARGVMWLTQAASGAENVLRIQVYGSKGGLVWQHADPNTLKHTAQLSPARLLTRGLPVLADAAKHATRVPPGHPEGFHEAFANLYADAAEAIAARRTGENANPLALDFPGVEDGARGVR